MVKQKIDSQIKTSIENGVKKFHRTMFVIVGDKSRDQVVNLHYILTKNLANDRPSVLWCHKKDLGFGSNNRKKMKEAKKKIKKGKVNINDEDPFDVFIASTDIHYCYYSETHKILGQTYGICVLQDFEALTPNLLARTIETVQGGGLVILLLPKISSLRQLYTMTMDVHDRYRTEAHNDIVGRFNQRLVLSFSSCEQCLVVDDTLNVLPISSHVFDAKPLTDYDMCGNDTELKILVESMKCTQPVGSILSCCKTLDQANALMKFNDAISEKTLNFTVSLTAARGRGKSAALGLAVSLAISWGYTFIFVTSPSPDNLKTFFEFVSKGLDALGYQKDSNYKLVESTDPEYNKAIVRINISKTNRQTIQYIHPTDFNKLGHAELLVIDEAAAIPLPLVKKMIGPYLIFLASTVNGYEGTGRSLSLKLLSELRTQSSNNHSSDCNNVLNRSLYEITLEESIRYKPGDSVEEWLNNLLCLNVSNFESQDSLFSASSDCDLYYVNRDTLFSYHNASEVFLQTMVSLFVSSHYKNSPNDLQLLSDAPSHHIFCLLGPVNKNKKILPEIYCVIQVCLEGNLSSEFILETFSNGRKPTGDLIPWTIGQQFLDKKFPSLPGLRVVRIATHPNCQSKGYGSRALSLLINYYNHELGLNTDEVEMDLDHQITNNCSEEVLLNEIIEPKSNLHPLLMKLTERPAEKIKYIGVSYGLTSDLLKFWKRNSFVPVYIGQVPNELTAEHSCVMIRALNNDECSWLPEYWSDFRERFSSLLSDDFCKMPTSLALSVLENKHVEKNISSFSKKFLDCHLKNHQLKRLEVYCNNMADYRFIKDLMPPLSRLFFCDNLGNFKCTKIQSAILLAIGLQHKGIDDLSKELSSPSYKLMGNLNSCIREIKKYLNTVTENKDLKFSKYVEQKKDSENHSVEKKKKRHSEFSASQLDEALKEETTEVQMKKKKKSNRNI